MELTLTMIRCPDSVVPEQRHVPGGDYVIGRGADASWVLPDPDRLLSKHHCVVEFRGGGWQVRDLSTNGTFINHADTPVGRDQVKMLEDGDRLRLGAYEIEVRVAMAGGQAAGSAWSGGGLPGGANTVGGGWDQAASPPAAGGWDTASSPGWASGPAAPAQDWGAPPQQQHAWGGQPQRDEPLQPRLPGDPYLGAKPPAAGTPGLPSGSGQPADFDPFNEGPAMPDHRPSTADAFTPPRPMQQVSVIPDSWDLGPTPSTPAAPPPPAPGGAPNRIPDDWNIDLSPGPAAAPPQRPAPPPAGPDPFAAPPAHPAGPDPFAAPAVRGPDPYVPPPQAHPAGLGPFAAPPGGGPDPLAAPPSRPAGPDPFAAPASRGPDPYAPPPQAQPAGSDPFAAPPPARHGPHMPPPASGHDPFAAPPPSADPVAGAAPARRIPKRRCARSAPRSTRRCRACGNC